MRAFLFLTLAVVLCLASFGKADPEARRRPSSRKEPFTAQNNKIQTGHYERPEEEDGVEKAQEAGDKRKGKLFSLFNIVTFKNEGCRSTSSLTSSSGNQFRNGTCFTQSECTSKGGSAAGSCAAGFGVCCVFLVSTSGGQITQNCTYIRNPGFPNSYDSNGAAQVTYTINKCSNDVCALRMDMEQFTIQGTGNTAEIDTTVTPNTVGGVCMDTFNVQTNTNDNIPTICGQNSGQHIYTEIGTQASDTAMLTFAFSGTSTNRIWEIKVSQVPCNSNYRQPEGCLQYHTGLTGRFSTFNFADSSDNHLQEQDYQVCIRQEEGFCCIQYLPCADANSFSLDTMGMATMMSQSDTACTLDYIGISGSAGQCFQGTSAGSVMSKYCGPFLNGLASMTLNQPICDCTAPFIIDVFTDTDVDIGDQATANTMPSRGVCLEWTQIPCN